MLDRETDPLPALPLVESPFFDELLPKLGLSAEAERLARALHMDGVASIDLDLGDIDAMRDRIAGLIAERLTKRHGKAYDAWQHAPEAGAEDVRALAAPAKAMALLEEVYRRPPVPISTINTRTGTEQGLHADGLFRATVPRRYYVTLWIPLEDIDEENGPIIAYPGSHRLPDYFYVDMGLTATEQSTLLEYYDQGYDRLFRRLVEAGGYTPRLYTPKAGEALIWVHGLIHGGMPILDPSRTRYVQINGITFQGCLYLTELNSDPYIGKVWLRDVVDVRTGAALPQIYNGRSLSVDEIERLKPDGIDALARSFAQSIERG
ncbi:MAG: phytanoyl-CoA dioxygenase family protein [Pseudomonadota bacterium]